MPDLPDDTSDEMKTYVAGILRRTIGATRAMEKIHAASVHLDTCGRTIRDLREIEGAGDINSELTSIMLHIVETQKALSRALVTINARFDSSLEPL